MNVIKPSYLIKFNSCAADHEVIFQDLIFVTIFMKRDINSFKTCSFSSLSMCLKHTPLLYRKGKFHFC